VSQIAARSIAVERVRLHRVRIPLVEPFRISNGAVEEKDAVVVEVVARGGASGWGEASPMSGSFYSDDTPDAAWSDLRDELAPLVVGAGEIAPASFYHALRAVSASSFAKAGIEGALWDALATLVNLPLCALLGGAPKPIVSGVAIGIYDTVAELLDRVDRYVARGYRRVKIKIQPGWDVEPVSAIRARYPDVPLTVDANAAYGLADVEVLAALDGFDLVMIEQPFAREAHDDAAALQRRIRTPICADESAESLEALDEIVAKRAAGIVNIKIQRVGGLGEARAMLDRARRAGLGAWVGTMPELGIASAHGLHFATLPGLDYPTDVEASERWYVDDVVDPLVDVGGEGSIHLPGGPGLGYHVSREKLDRYGIAREEISR